MSVTTSESSFTLPRDITPAHVAAMADAGEHHRYELTADGVLVVSPPSTLAHQRIVSELICWFIKQGFDVEQIYYAVGIFTGGARQPDVTIWTREGPEPKVSEYCGTDNLLLVIEIVSPATRVEDEVRKREEYARAGIPRYWIIEQDEPQTVKMLALDDKSGEYVQAMPSPQPLRWLLTTKPQEHLGQA